MVVTRQENKTLTIKEQSVDGILIYVMLVGATVDQALVASDFTPSEVNLKTILYRNKQQIVITQDNLQILGLYSALQFGLNGWYRGNVVNYDDGDEVETNLFH